MRVRLRIEVGARGEGALVDIPSGDADGPDAIELFARAIAVSMASIGAIGESAGQAPRDWQQQALRHALELVESGLEMRSGKVSTRTKR